MGVMRAVDDVVTRALVAVAVVEGFVVTRWLEGLLVLLVEVAVVRDDGGATREERGGDVTVATDMDGSLLIFL